MKIIVGAILLISSLSAYASGPFDSYKKNTDIHDGVAVIAFQSSTTAAVNLGPSPLQAPCPTVSLYYTNTANKFTFTTDENGSNPVLIAQLSSAGLDVISFKASAVCPEGQMKDSAPNYIGLYCLNNPC